MDTGISFSRWLRQRRRALDLTQADLAAQVGCAPDTLRKIEAGGLRPSRQIAERLAELLAIPDDERITFIRLARSSSRAAHMNGQAERGPYVGLNTFQDGDAALFFGREATVAALIEQLRAARFLAVLGPSGSGKSSVVLAGLLPALRRGELPGSAYWRYRTIRPGARPLDALAAALADDRQPTTDHRRPGIDSPPGEQRTQNKEQKGHELQTTSPEPETANLRSAICDLQSPLVLVVDQFEELWTQAPAERAACEAHRERQQYPFIAALLAAADNPGDPVYVVITLRADFLHRAAEHSELARAIAAHDLIVSPMMPDELRRAIELPAQVAGGAFEPGLVDELIVQTAGRPGALPLLEYTLLELWNARRSDGAMTWAAFRALGGVEGALAATADAILAEHYTPAEQGQLRHLLVRLVQPGQDAADTRRRALLADLTPAGSLVEDLRALLAPLVEARLLVVTVTDHRPPETGDPRPETRDRRPSDSITTDHRPPTTDNGPPLYGGSSVAAPSSIDPTPPTDDGRRTTDDGQVVVEIAHEALIHAWPTFNHWISAAREDLRFQLQLEEAAREWQHSGEHAELLWSELRLARGEEWLARARPQLNEREQHFIEASRTRAEALRAIAEATRRERERLLFERESERRGAARLRVFLGVAGALLLVALLFAGIALNRQQAAQRAEAEAQQAAQAERSFAYAGEALDELDRRPERALLLIRAALAISSTADRSPLVARALYRTFEEALIRKSLAGHTGPVRAVAWSPDGRYLLTCGDDQTVRIWDGATGQLVRTLAGHSGPVRAVAWSPDGQQIASGAGDQTARIWDAASGQLVHTFTGHDGWVSAIIWSPDGRQIASGSYDTTVRIWNAETGRLVRTLEGHSGPVRAVVWSPDGQQIASSGDDTTVRIWEAAGGTARRVLEGHAGGVWSVAWSPDGQQIIAGNDNNTAHIWEAATGTLVQTLKGHAGWIWSAAWSADGRQALTGSFDGTARIWDVATGTTLHILRGHGAKVWSVAWSPDQRRIATASDDGTTRVWDASTGLTIERLRGDPLVVGQLRWSADRRYAVRWGVDRIVYIWDMISGKQLRTLEIPREPVRAVAWSPDGRQIATGGDDMTARIWDAAAGSVVRVLEGHTGGIRILAWRPDGLQIVTGGTDRTARIWDSATGQLVRTLEGHPGWVSAAAWSPDGRSIATGGDDGATRVWDAASGQLLQTFESRAGMIRAVIWSPDSRQLATGGDDGAARVWDVAVGRLVYTLEGHTGAIVAAAWDPGGRRLATGGDDGTARIWNSVSGTAERTLLGHVGRITALAWSPDGRQLTTAGDDGTTSVWLVDRQLIVADISRRMCDLLADDEIRRTIPAWRGCSVELAAVAGELAAYDALEGGQ